MRSMNAARDGWNLTSRVEIRCERRPQRSQRPLGSDQWKSDLDLSLIYNPPEPPVIDETLGALFHEILHTTLDSWRGEVELNLAVIFPLRACGLACFQVTHYDPSICPQGGMDCFGIYKIQKGFSGFVLNAGIQVERMYPCFTIWSKPGS